MEKKLLTISETSEFLGVSIDTLRRWDKKGILKAFRPFINSHRLYQMDDIERFLGEDLVKLARKWILKNEGDEPQESFYCKTSDIFHARLERLQNDLSSIEILKKIFTLIIAITGEIGNNSYNHNLGNWRDIPGIFFTWDIQKGQIVLADRGLGILKTLKRVKPELNTHEDALKTAFTEYISGRAPESRGNGLKFVKEVVSNNPIGLEFQSGDAKLNIETDSKDFNIINTKTYFNGCFTLITF